MKTPFAFALATLIAISSITARAATFFPERKLDASILAEVVNSGGFMAPGFVNTTVYTIKKSGDIERTSYHRGDLTRVEQSVVWVGKMNAEVQLRLERAIATIHEGKLVDIDPSAPTGADAQNIAYNVNQNGKLVTVANRGGNFHTYALKQKAALTVMHLLENAIRQ